MPSLSGSTGLWKMPPRSFCRICRCSDSTLVTHAGRSRRRFASRGLASVALRFEPASAPPMPSASTPRLSPPPRRFAWRNSFRCTKIRSSFFSSRSARFSSLRRLFTSSADSGAAPPNPPASISPAPLSSKTLLVGLRARLPRSAAACAAAAAAAAALCGGGGPGKCDRSSASSSVYPGGSLLAKASACLRVRNSSPRSAMTAATVLSTPHAKRCKRRKPAPPERTASDLPDDADPPAQSAPEGSRSTKSRGKLATRPKT
mmetsp:Transcript_21164/g.68487  ORF Transcript_21164/g.68487 Transcript_21164/m.68487 type:complete len:260 (-) Transcript_21164:6-785(-)